jgi:hypothetical protein
MIATLLATSVQHCPLLSDVGRPPATQSGQAGFRYSALVTRHGV